MSNFYHKVTYKDESVYYFNSLSQLWNHGSGLLQAHTRWSDEGLVTLTIPVDNIKNIESTKIRKT